eukprot:COSAG02_NODE_530_length_20697_cov_20.103457_25_plen_162_part_00
MDRIVAGLRSAAAMRGVRSSGSRPFALGSAPALSNILTMRLCPFQLAAMSGVPKSVSSSFPACAFTFAPSTQERRRRHNGEIRWQRVVKLRSFGLWGTASYFLGERTAFSLCARAMRIRVTSTLSISAAMSSRLRPSRSFQSGFFGLSCGISSRSSLPGSA